MPFLISAREKVCDSFPINPRVAHAVEVTLATVSTLIRV